jgi:hypothetical protein
MTMDAADRAISGTIKYRISMSKDYTPTTGRQAPKKDVMGIFAHYENHRDTDLAFLHPIHRVRSRRRDPLPFAKE